MAAILVLPFQPSRRHRRPSQRLAISLYKHVFVLGLQISELPLDAAGVGSPPLPSSHMPWRLEALAARRSEAVLGAGTDFRREWVLWVAHLLRRAEWLSLGSARRAICASMSGGEAGAANSTRPQQNCRPAARH